MNDVKMKIYRLDLDDLIIKENGKFDRVPMPAYATDGSAAFDLYSANTQTVTVPPHSTVRVPLGIKVAVEPGYKLVITSRSGFAAKGILVATVPGKIDSDYRGEVIAPILNTTDNPFEIEPLTRICQGEIEVAPQYGFVEVSSEEALGSTARGEGGLGSTGEGLHGGAK